MLSLLGNITEGPLYLFIFNNAIICNIDFIRPISDFPTNATVQTHLVCHDTINSTAYLFTVPTVFPGSCYFLLYVISKILVL